MKAQFHFPYSKRTNTVCPFQTKKDKYCLSNSLEPDNLRDGGEQNDDRCEFVRQCLTNSKQRKRI
jgi:hypothetical protein